MAPFGMEIQGDVIFEHRSVPGDGPKEKTYYFLNFISYLHHGRTQEWICVPTLGANAPPLVRHTKTRAFGAWTTWRTFQDPQHSGHGALYRVKRVFAREQLLQKFS